VVDPITSGVLAELIAGALASLVGKAWAKVRGTPEGRAVKAAIGAAVVEALVEQEDSQRPWVWHEVAPACLPLADLSGRCRPAAVQGRRPVRLTLEVYLPGAAARGMGPSSCSQTV
jgi:hypothetical protein